jgi:uncharacterized protein YjbJ (UPF0337 family)
MFEHPAAWESAPTRREATHGLEKKDRITPYYPADHLVDRHERESLEPGTPLREESFMAETNKSGPAEAVKGVVEDVKGRVKEAVGAVSGQDDLTREGQAQQDKAEAQRNAAKKEAEAEAARGSAQVAEERQKSNQ